MAKQRLSGLDALMDRIPLPVEGEEPRVPARESDQSITRDADPLPKVDFSAVMDSPEVRNNGSNAEALHPIADCLRASEELIGTDKEWVFPDNPTAKMFGNVLPKLKRELSKIDNETLESIARKGDVEAINQFLAQKGFSIQLEPIGPDEIAVASVLDLRVEWNKKGQKVPVNLGGEEGRRTRGGRCETVPGVKLKDGVTFYKAPSHDHVIAELPLKEGSKDRVFITRWDKDFPVGSFELTALATQFSQEKQIDNPERTEGVIFPMVDFDQEVDLDWITGAQTMGDDGLPVIVSQAKQQNKLRMNEVGARAQSAVAMSMMRGISMNQPLVINGPFLVWFEREGFDMPFFVAGITKEHMKNPGSLG